MPDIETCKAKTTIIIGELTEADVECGKEPHGAEEAHLTTQDTTWKRDKQTGQARIAFLWW